MRSIQLGFYMTIELALRIIIHPRLRALLLKILGAHIGHNVRIYECKFINLDKGFSNLQVADDVHIGRDCLFDLKGKVIIEKGSVLSPRVTVISHTDPGSAHNSPRIQDYPCETNITKVGKYCWIGTCTTILSGTEIGDNTVLGAMSLAKGKIESNSVYVGVPAKIIKGIAQ